MSVSQEEFAALKAELEALKQQVNPASEASEEDEIVEEEASRVRVNHQAALRRIMGLNVNKAATSTYLLWSFIRSHYKSNYRDFLVVKRDPEYFVVKARIPSLFINIRFDGRSEGVKFFAQKATVTFKDETVATLEFFVAKEEQA